MESDGDLDDRGDDRGDETSDETANEHAPPRPVDRFRKTTVGSVVAAGLFGLRDALEGRPEREEIAIVSEAPESPVDDGMELVFDEDSKTVTVVLRKPRA